MTNRLISQILIVVALLSSLNSGLSLRAQAPERMTSSQYAFFLNELESKLPLLNSHFASLCATPGWRSESRALVNVSNQVFASCNRLSTDMLAYFKTTIKDERVLTKLSEEYKMEFALRELTNMATGASNMRPAYDARGEDADFILKNLGPLTLTLYSHVYASISDDPNCVRK